MTKGGAKIHAFFGEKWSWHCPSSGIHRKEAIIQRPRIYATKQAEGAYSMEHAHFWIRCRKGDQHPTVMFSAWRASGKTLRPRQRSTTVIEARGST